MDNLLKVGKIVNTHGIHGEVKVIPITDFVEERFQKNNQLLVVTSSYEEKTVTIKSHRKHKQFELLTFEEYDTINEVEQLKGLTLYIKKEKLHQLKEGEYYYFEIIDCLVVTKEGKEIGIVQEILSPGANDVWVVYDSKNAREYYIPFIDEVVKQINIKEKKILIHPLEGLLDE